MIGDNAAKMLGDGRQIFRFDTFGDEAFWGDALHYDTVFKLNLTAQEKNDVIQYLRGL